MTGLLSRKLFWGVTLVLAAAYLFGRPIAMVSSQNLSESGSFSGYHIGSNKPRGKVGHCALHNQESLEVELLKTTLTALKGGHLEEAISALSQLVAVVPEEQCYHSLLNLACRQLETEGWYRFQSKFNPSDNSHKLEPVLNSFQSKSLNELVVLRLRLATWLNTGQPKH